MRRTATILTLSFALSASACGVNDDATPTIDLPDSSAETTSTTEATTTSSEAETTTTEATTTTSAEETTTTETAVAGEPLDFAPPAATPLIVVGVRYDDVLNFRDDPSPSADILATSAPLDPDASIQALGSAWSAPSGVWWEVEIDGGLAWANQAFLGAPGVTIDVFAEVSAELETLDFATVEEAGLAVAATRASEEPASAIELASEPLAFDGVGGFVIVDVIGLGDDSVKGERLRVDVALVYDEEGEEGAQDVIGVTLTAVEAQAICGRGVTDDGLCV